MIWGKISYLFLAEGVKKACWDDAKQIIQWMVLSLGATETDIHTNGPEKKNNIIIVKTPRLLLFWSRCSFTLILPPHLIFFFFEHPTTIAQKSLKKFTYGQSYSCFFTPFFSVEKKIFNLSLFSFLSGWDGCYLLLVARIWGLTLNSRKKIWNKSFEFLRFSYEQCNLIFLSWRFIGPGRQSKRHTMRYRTNLFHFPLVFVSSYVLTLTHQDHVGL